jgi:predicted NAD/FAD-binding protein
MDRMKVAVVGSGISGLTAAYVLNGEHDVRLFEREPAAGGHTATVSIQTDRGRVAVDTGFIVYNETTYPLFTRLLAELGVETQPSDMSFGCTCGSLRHRVQQPRGRRLVPAARDGPSALALEHDPRGPALLRRRPPAPRLGRDTRDTLGDFLDRGRYGSAFRNHFIVPVTSAVWSTAADRILDFPADYLLHFLDNHGLIGYPSKVKWRVVKGGSNEYVKKILATLPARRRAPRQRRRVGHAGRGRRHRDHGRRGRGAVRRRGDGHSRRRCPGPAGRRRPAERNALSGFDYSQNLVVLHTDERVMPKAAGRGPPGTWTWPTAAARAAK